MTDPFDSGYLYYLAHKNSVVALIATKVSRKMEKGRNLFKRLNENVWRWMFTVCHDSQDPPVKLSSNTEFMRWINRRLYKCGVTELGLK